MARISLRWKILSYSGGLLVALAGILGSAMFARTVTAPVAKLVEGTRQVAAGNFDFCLDVRSRDEIGTLADSFNSMTQGLRERADMQKFVSRSTVEAIRGQLQKSGTAGERQFLTVLFSDMRGFTSIAEQMAPEDVVQMLNACLILQTGQITKFKGDVDKFVGDCVVALFVGEDSTLRAIRCGVKIHQAIEQYNQVSGADPPLGIGVSQQNGGEKSQVVEAIAAHAGVEVQPRCRAPAPLHKSSRRFRQLPERPGKGVDILAHIPLAAETKTPGASVEVQGRRPAGDAAVHIDINRGVARLPLNLA